MPSSSIPRSRWDVCAGGQPIAVFLEFDPEPVVIDPEIAVAAGCYRLRHHALDLLRHDADIGRAAADIAEAVEAKTVGEVTERNDIVLQRDIGAPASTATAAAKTSASAATASKAA